MWELLVQPMPRDSRPALRFPDSSRKSPAPERPPAVSFTHLLYGSLPSVNFSGPGMTRSTILSPSPPKGFFVDELSSLSFSL